MHVHVPVCEFCIHTYTVCSYDYDVMCSHHVQGFLWIMALIPTIVWKLVLFEGFIRRTLE